jgi:hypothetical protein
MAETAYTNYARQAIARSGSGFSRTNNIVTNVAQLTFPKAGATGSAGNITKVAIYTALTNGTKIHEYTLGTAFPVTANTTQPIIEAGQLSITGGSDTRTDTHIQEILDLVYLNQAFANIGDANGLQPSATAGSLYVGLEE